MNLRNLLQSNGAKFYDLPLNENTISLEKTEWLIPEYIEENSIKIKNFFGNKKINWKLANLKV